MKGEFRYNVLSFSDTRYINLTSRVEKYLNENTDTIDVISMNMFVKPHEELYMATVLVKEYKKEELI